MRILVTGASGFIGSPIVQSFHLKGHTVLAISRNIPEDAKLLCVKWLQADLTNPSEYKDTVRDFAPEAFIHLAWYGLPDYSFSTSRDNLKQSLDLLSFIVGLGSCRKILVSGSCWEFDRLKGRCLEKEIGQPKDDFTWAKHSLRSWLEMQCGKNDISFYWMRIFYVYGPRQRLASLIPGIMTHLKEGKLPEIRAPMNANDFVYVDDVADAFLRAVFRDFPSGIYNIGSGRSTTVLEVCRKAEKIVNSSETLTKKLELETMEVECKIDFWADYSCSYKMFGWSPATSLDEGLRQTWKWMMET